MHNRPRRPVRFQVTVDGRPVGDTFRSSGLANAYADSLREESPWSIIEVTQAY